MEQKETMAMTTKQCAETLQITELTLLTWVKQKKIPAVRIGGRKYLFSRKMIEEVLKGNYQSPEDKAPAD